ncbi:MULTISPECIES: ferric reductase-like transmembrane domain-containing protein [unclassified Streptomyces]|uniref:ferredoxin reductase family protein n=1 Tax=unclassified Streptomyces TaxID=2593676 RepID=UPI0006FA78F3|nr:MULTISPECIES: ferric reductase-like transmembrane domain-containing protein [unclassified Streptomyces]KQX46270.1 ferric reductase [Streptomyces sp. Root1304]KRA81055.1 ferric reductase [Streptomyces sp. Root66D1]
MSTEVARTVRPGGRRRGGRAAAGSATVAMLSAQAAIWVGAAAVLALWWVDTASVVGPAGWFTGAGRITGLLAGYACAVLVVLMARIPLLDRTVGTDRITRWHAAAGRYTIGLTLAHAVLIIEGYALTGRTDPVTEGVRVVLHYPDMLKTTAGLLLLLLTAAVSARAARRRLSHETWYYLHLLTYAAVFLAFGHQITNGADFDRPAVRAAWYVLYAGAAALIVWFRMLTPLRLSRRHGLRVAGVRWEAPDVVSVLVTGERMDELTVRPGQFFRWRFLAPGLWWTASPYSVSAVPDGRSLRITVKALGGHSAALATVRPGTRVWAEGPYGALTPDRAAGRPVLLLAAGVGITPLRVLFETLPRDPVLIHWARRPEDLVLRHELDAIASRRGAHAYYSVSHPAGHHLPLEAATLRSLVPDVAGRTCFLCGPPGWTAAAEAALREAGVPAHRIHHESFTW